MSTSGDANSSASSNPDDTDSRRREIAAGKRPASPSTGDSTPQPPTDRSDNDDPDGPLVLMDQAIASLHRRSRLRRRLGQEADGTDSAGFAKGAPSPAVHPTSQPAAQDTHLQPPPPAGTLPRVPSLLRDILQRPPSAPPASTYFPPGRCFLRMFQRPIKSFLALPRGFGETIRHELLPTVYLTGDTALPHLVTVHEVDGRLYFTHGWDRFVLAERIMPDDLGLFIVAGPHRVTMRLYARNGLEKPFSSRPQGLDPDAPPPAGTNVHVPSHILAMEFELGPRVSVNSQIMQQLANVWSTRHSNNPLYVCKVLASHINKGGLYFGTRFSSMLPYTYRTPAALFFGNSVEFIRGTITKTPKHHELARVSTGFGSFVRQNDIHPDDILVIRVRHLDNAYRVRIYKVPA